MNLERKQIQDLYIRICKDSGFRIEYINAAILTAKILNISPLEVWIAFGDLKTMERIATKQHPITQDKL